MPYRPAIALRALLTIVLLIASVPAHAVTLLRDADLEYGLKQLATPVLKAAGLSPNRVKILVVDDRSLNAFVISNDAIFLHSGLILKLNSAAQLQSVIAHEAAHISNGHLTRRMTNIGASRNAALLGIALAIATAAAGGGEAAGGIALGTQSAAQRAFFRHTRAEEASADISAVRYMRSAGIDPKGMAEVLEIFQGQEVLAANRQDPYVRSHPLSRDRLRAVKAQTVSGQVFAPRPNDAYWFARAKGKLSAYQRGPKWSLRRAGESGYADVKAIRQAVAHLRQSQTTRALRVIDRVIASRPQDPFLLDLKAEILLKSRDFAGASRVYQQAAQLAPREPLILAGLGRALLAQGRASEAVPVLERARSIDYRDGIMLRDLGQAYSKIGQPGMAMLTSSERYALTGNLDTAGIHAKRAMGLLSEGSGPWRRAQDVFIASERIKKTRR